MTCKQLYDPRESISYTINGKAMIFKVAGDDIHKEIHLKPHHAAILFALFTDHPGPVSYKTIKHGSSRHR